MIVTHKSYELPSEIQVIPPANSKISKVTYFSDCIFKPYTYGSFLLTQISDLRAHRTVMKARSLM